MPVVLLLVLAVAAASATIAHRAAERARRSVRMADGRFLLALSGLLAKMAMADGTVSADEIETVEKTFSDMGLSRAERALCVGNFVIVQREGGDARALARELAGSPPAKRALMQVGRARGVGHAFGQPIAARTRKTWYNLRHP